MHRGQPGLESKMPVAQRWRGTERGERQVKARPRKRKNEWLYAT
jgi:hypothetical protein